jgi:hypothetical protein
VALSSFLSRGDNLGAIWDIINKAFSLSFVVEGIKITFWELTIGFTLLNLAVRFLKNLFE